MLLLSGVDSRASMLGVEHQLGADGSSATLAEHLQAQPGARVVDPQNLLHNAYPTVIQEALAGTRRRGTKVPTCIAPAG
ncbi:MAG: hypothetical protein ACI9N0_002011 [Ilumatobacter sp.]|jgi:hypothetical protein